MPLTFQDFNALMKTDYHGPIIDTLENTCAMLNRVEKEELETGGNLAYFPRRSGRTGSIGARSDNASELLPAGDRPRYGFSTWSVKSLYATLRITGKVIRASKKPTLAFAKAQVQDMEDTVKDLRKDVNRQLFGDGSAELCQIVSLASGSPNTVTVSSNLYPTNPTKFLKFSVGMKVDIRTFADGVLVANGDSITITGVPSSTTFTYTGTAFTPATTQAVYREDNVGPVSEGSATQEIKEIFGLYGIIDDENPDAIWAASRITADIGNVDRSSAANADWLAQVLHNSGTRRPFSLGLVEQGIDESEINAGGVISLIQTNHAIYRIYGLQMAALKQADIIKMDLDGGFKALSVNGIPMVKDVECPDYTMFLIDEEYWKFIHQGEWEWIEEGNGTVLTRLPQQDQYEAVMVRDCQFVCTKPSAQVKIEDVSHS